MKEDWPERLLVTMKASMKNGRKKDDRSKKCMKSALNDAMHIKRMCRSDVRNETIKSILMV